MVRHSAAAANLATIRKGLADVWTTQGRSFVTFEGRTPGGDDADRWIQYLDGELNVRWPLDEEPAVALAARGVPLPPGAFPGWHVAGQNAVFEVGDASAEDVARLVLALLTRIVAGTPDIRVTARVDAHS